MNAAPTADRLHLILDARGWHAVTEQYIQLADESRNLKLDMVAAEWWSGRRPNFYSRRFVAWA